MKPRRLLLENIHSFRGRHEIDFTSISSAVVAGINGGGKSTAVVDAPIYCLFGETRGDANSIVSEGEQVGRVEFEFSLGDEVFLVSRQRNTRGSGSTILSFLRLTASGPEVLDGKTIGETQARIESVLHMTADLLRATSFSTQGDASRFAKARPADRKLVLGDILDLGLWERRAETARALIKTEDAQRLAKATAAEQAEAKAAFIPQIEAQAEEVAEKIDFLRERFGAFEIELIALGNEREKLLADRAADASRRESLKEAQAQLETANGTRVAKQMRVEEITRTTERRQAVVDALTVAESYAAEAQELEAKRQERERIAGEGKELDAQIKAAKAEYQTAVNTLTFRVRQAINTHSHDLEKRRQFIAQLAKQAEVLDSVPCAIAGNTPLVDACPLIAQAREAKQLLPSAQADLDRIANETPWAGDGARLKEQEAQVPAADLIAKRNELAQRYKAIAYDAEAHAQAKRFAADRDKHQSELAQIDAQAALLPDARAELEAAETELRRLTDKVKQLTESLGPERTWDQEIAEVDRQIAAAKAECDRLRREIEVAQQQQGSLSEQLRQAQEAAEQVKVLREEIAEIDRRINILKLLGNPGDGAFSKGGIPALLIERAVPELEAAANEVLETLSDGRLSLSLRTQKENSSKGLSETLDVVVSDERGERLYETFSGGESMRVDLALRVGLSTLMAQRAGARCELLVLDETCAPLDVRGREQFVEAVGKIADRFATVLVVTHCDDLKDQFPCRIEVSKDADGSKVEVMQ